MDEKYIQELYNQLGGKNKFGDYKDFQGLITTNTDYQKAFHKEIGEKVLGNFNDFSTLVKKKDGTQISQPTSSNLQGGVATPKPISTPSQLREEQQFSQELRNRQLFEQRFRPIGGEISSRFNIPNIPKQESEAVLKERETQVYRGENTKKMHDEAFVRTAKRRLTTYSQQGEKIVPNKVEDKDLNNEIEKVKSDYEKGDLGLVNNKKGELELVPTSGFWHNAGEHLYESVNAPVKAFDIHLAAVQNNNKKLVKLLKERAEEQPDVPETAPSSFMGNLGATLGGAVVPVALTEATGGTGLAAETMWTSYASNLEKLYWEGISKGLTEEQAIEQAKRPAEFNAALEGATAYGMTKLHTGNSGIVSNVLNRLPNQTAKEALVNSVKNVAKNATKIGGLGALQETAKAGVEKLAGYDIKLEDVLKRDIGAFKDWAIMDLSFAFLKNTGEFANVPKVLKSQAKEYLATLPDHLVDRTLFELGEKGETIKQSLDKYRQIRSQFEGVVPENQVGTFAGWQEKINSLKEKNTELQSKINPDITEVANEPIKKQIAANDAEIAKAEDTLKEYLEKGKIVEKDNLTGDVLNEPIKEENVTAENVNAIKKAYNEDLSDIDNKITNLDKNKYDYQFELDDLTKQRNEIVDYYENQLKNEQSKKVPTTTRPQTPSIEEAQKPIEPTNESITGVAEPIATKTESITETKVDNATQPTEEVKVEVQPLDSDTIQYLHIMDASGKKAMSKEQIKSAIEDIENGIPSVGTDTLLNTIEQATKDGNLPVIESGFKTSIPLEDALNVKKEVIGEPFSEENLMNWLNEESQNLTPEHQEILDNELNNIIYEYEQGGIEIEIPKSNTTAETTSSKIVEPKVSDATVNEKASQEVTNVFTESDNPSREGKSKKALIDARKEVFEKYKEKYGEDVKEKVKDINSNFEKYTKALKEVGEIIKIEC
jgi:hypothetical protein